MDCVPSWVAEAATEVQGAKNWALCFLRLRVARPGHWASSGGHGPGTVLPPGGTAQALCFLRVARPRHCASSGRHGLGNYTARNRENNGDQHGTAGTCSGNVASWHRKDWHVSRGGNTGQRGMGTMPDSGVIKAMPASGAVAATPASGSVVATQAGGAVAATRTPGPSRQRRPQLQETKKILAVWRMGELSSTTTLVLSV